jgi:hypothetical protein
LQRLPLIYTATPRGSLGKRIVSYIRIINVYNSGQTYCFASTIAASMPLAKVIIYWTFVEGVHCTKIVVTAKVTSDNMLRILKGRCKICHPKTNGIKDKVYNYFLILQTVQ